MCVTILCSAKERGICISANIPLNSVVKTNAIAIISDAIKQNTSKHGAHELRHNQTPTNNVEATCLLTHILAKFLLTAIHIEI